MIIPVISQYLLITSFPAEHYSSLSISDSSIDQCNTIDQFTPNPVISKTIVVSKWSPICIHLHVLWLSRCLLLSILLNYCLFLCSSVIEFLRSQNCIFKFQKMHYPLEISVMPWNCLMNCILYNSAIDLNKVHKWGDKFLFQMHRESWAMLYFNNFYGTSQIASSKYHLNNLF